MIPNLDLKQVAIDITESDWAFANRDGSSNETNDASIRIYDLVTLELTTQVSKTTEKIFNPETMKEPTPLKRTTVSVPIEDSPRGLNLHLIHQEFTEPSFSDSFIKFTHSLCPCLFKQPNKGL